MNKKTPKKHSTLSNTLFALKWQFEIAPGYTVFTLMQTVLGDVVTLFEHTFLTAYIIICVEQKKTLTDVLYFLIPVAIAVFIKLMLNTVFDAYIAPGEREKIQMKMRMRLYEKAASIELARYDDSGFYNDFVWAMQKAPDHITGAVGAFNTLLSRITVSIIAGAYIVSVDASSLLILVFLIPFTYFSGRAINKRAMKMQEEIVPVQRRSDYVSRIFYLADYVKDLKTGNISPKLEKDLSDSTEEMRAIVKKRQKPIIALNVATNSAADLIISGVYLSYLFFRALVLGKFGLGSLLGVYNSTQTLNGKVLTAVSNLSEFQNHSLYIEKLRRFSETENTMEDNGRKALPAGGDIVLRNVEFTYPGNSEPTLKDVSCSFKRGEKVALVGFNGAGKSTLIKLILRLYDPSVGEISYGGENIKSYRISDYRGCFGVLFQDYELIATDLAHNISADNKPLDINRADEALKKSAFWDKFETLPKGYETQLTKEFDESGFNPSGGEKQKIALARVLYADSDIIILDEPSGALDPIAEYTLNKTVTELSSDKTVIIISHRLSTPRFADKIYMLANGEIIESGTHGKLIKQNGKYAEMFRLQAEKYR